MTTDYAHVPEQPVVRFVLGVPRVGKSTVARALVQRLVGAARVAGDLVRHRLTVAGVVRGPRATDLGGVAAPGRG